MRRLLSHIVYLLLTPGLVPAQQTFSLWHGQQRSLRYRPEGNDFVIVNGERRFNRALYGTHTAFRVEAGDLPEFALYLPGMGGNWRFGLQRGDHRQWLTHANNIRAVYRHDTITYKINKRVMAKIKRTMKYRFFLMFGIFLLVQKDTKAQPDDPAWTREVGARAFPSSGATISVNTHGAVKDGLTLCTRPIQAAIDECAAKGGGAVVFEPGAYLTGSIFLKEGVELRIDKGVELKGSQHFEDYPEIDTRIAGIEMKWPAALLNIIGVKKAAITGEGRVNAQGKFCWDKYWAMRKDYDSKGLRWIVDYDAKRVRTLLIQNASDVTVRGVRFVDAGFWTVQVLYSKYVTVDGIIVRNNENGHGPSTDGVDIDSSTWVLVQNCDIDCNDDDFCLKAGRDWDGLRVNRPTEYVVIRKCTARKGGGLLTLGSETAGGIRHVLATDLTAKGTGNGFHIKSATTRGGTVEDIHIRNITMDSVGNAILFTMNWNPAYSYSTLPKGYNPDSIPSHWRTMLHAVEPPEKGIPHFKDIYVSGIKVASARKAISATGLDRSLITGVHIDNMEIAATTAGEIDYAKDWDLKNVSISTKDGTKLQIKNSGNVTFN